MSYDKARKGWFSCESWLEDPNGSQTDNVTNQYGDARYVLQVSNRSFIPCSIDFFQVTTLSNPQHLEFEEAPMSNNRTWQGMNLIHLPPGSPWRPVTNSVRSKVKKVKSQLTKEYIHARVGFTYSTIDTLHLTNMVLL